MSVLIEGRIVHSVDPDTVERGFVKEGDVSDLAVIGRGRERNEWYVFWKNSQRKSIRAVKRELKGIRESEPSLGEHLVTGVGIQSTPDEEIQFDHHHIGIWVRKDPGIRIIPFGLLNDQPGKILSH